MFHLDQRNTKGKTIHMENTLPLLRNKPHCLSTQFSNIKELAKTFLKHCQP